MIQGLIVGVIVISALGFLVKKSFFTPKKCGSCSMNPKTLPTNEERM